MKAPNTCQKRSRATCFGPSCFSVTHQIQSHIKKSANARGSLSEKISIKVWNQDVWITNVERINSSAWVSSAWREESTVIYVIIVSTFLFYSANDCIFCVRCLVRDRVHLLTMDCSVIYAKALVSSLEKNRISENILDHTCYRSDNSDSDVFRELSPRNYGQGRGATDTTVSK